jgi:putative inorganic carbon (HCO3(-)) transporter
LFFIVRHERIHQNLKIETLFQALGVTAIILSIIGITQWLTGAGLPIPWDIERRVTSVFDYPNALGLFLGPIIIMSVLNHFSDDRNETKVPVKFFWTVVATCSSIAIFLAQSEAAIVSVIATLLIAGFLYRKTRLLSLCFLGLSILCTLLYPPLFQKLTLQDYSGQVRLTQWNETINLLQDHWLLGVGLSGYPAALEPHHQATHLEIFQYPHNLVLNIWVELGLLGLIACLLLLWQVLSTVSRLPSTPIAFFALLQMIIHGLVDVPFLKNDLAVLTFLLLAIIFSYAHPRVPATTSR